MLGLFFHVVGSSRVKYKWLELVPYDIIFPMIEQLTSFLKPKVMNWPNLAKAGEVWVLSLIWGVHVCIFLGGMLGWIWDVGLNVCTFDHLTSLVKLAKQFNGSSNHSLSLHTKYLFGFLNIQGEVKVRWMHSATHQNPSFITICLPPIPSKHCKFQQANTGSPIFLATLRKLFHRWDVVCLVSFFADLFKEPDLARQSYMESLSTIFYVLLPELFLTFFRCFPVMERTNINMQAHIIAQALE